MFVSVELYLKAERQLGLGRTGFWRTFKALRGDFFDRRGRDGDGRDGERGELPPISPEEIADYEEQFKFRFAEALERQVNVFLPSVAARTRRSKRIEPIRIKLVAVQYGSIKPILDIIGVENSDIQNFVLTALSVYAPLAFNEALHAQVDIEAGVPEILGAPKPVISPTSDVAARAWTIANLTLVVPVALSLIVIYYAYSGLLHELEGLRAQATELRLERSDIIKAIVEQNRVLSMSNADQAKQALTNEKAMQEAIITIIKDHTVTGK
jgi:hypothetical protein